MSFALYLGFAFVFRSPFWSFLYHSAGLFIYYFFLRVIGVESVFSSEGSTISWLVLIPATAYIFLGLLYEKKELPEEGRYSYVIGSITVILCCIRLFAETSAGGKEYFSWLLLGLGIAYYRLGIFFERANFQKYCRLPYFIGVGVVFFSLFRLGADGTLLNGYPAPSYEKGYQNIVGWSNLIVGTIFLLLGWGIEKLRNFHLEIGPRYKGFFNFVGPLWFLGAILSLGLDGHKLVYETALLVSSIGFIFGSIPKLSRQFLYIGTLFLVIYIFSTGSEYFQNDVGWPITLFAAGLASMGVSLAIEKVRRKYFTSVKT